MMKFNRKRLSISIMLIILVIVLLLFINMDIFTQSRYESVVSSQNSISTAVYLLEDTYQTINVKLPDVIPSNNQYTYSFSVSNYNNDKHSDTNLKYRIHIRTTTNMEIDYDLFKTLDITNATSCVDTNSAIQDSYGTYFRHIYTGYSTMLYSEDKTDYYTILFTFPQDEDDVEDNPDNIHDAKYSGIAELIEINIESQQILQDDP